MNDQSPKYPHRPIMRLVPLPAPQSNESLVPVFFAVFVAVVIVLIVAGVVIHDATSTPAADAASVTKPSAQPGVPVPQGCVR